MGKRCRHTKAQILNSKTPTQWQKCESSFSSPTQKRKKINKQVRQRRNSSKILTCLMRTSTNKAKNILRPKLKARRENIFPIGHQMSNLTRQLHRSSTKPSSKRTKWRKQQRRTRTRPKKRSTRSTALRHLAVNKPLRGTDCSTRTSPQNDFKQILPNKSTTKDRKKNEKKWQSSHASHNDCRKLKSTGFPENEQKNCGNLGHSLTATSTLCRLARTTIVQLSAKINVHNYDF